MFLERMFSVEPEVTRTAVYTHSFGAGVGDFAVSFSRNVCIRSFVERHCAKLVMLLSRADVCEADVVLACADPNAYLYAFGPAAHD